MDKRFFDLTVNEVFKEKHQTNAFKLPHRMSINNFLIAIHMDSFDEFIEQSEPYIEHDVDRDKIDKEDVGEFHCLCARCGKILVYQRNWQTGLCERCLEYMDNHFDSHYEFSFADLNDWRELNNKI